MRTIILFFCTALASSSGGMAQTDAVNVAYLKGVPTAVRARMPRNGQSIFYGVTALKVDGQKLALNYYRYFSKKRAGDKPDYGLPEGTVMLFAVDLFRITPDKGRKGKSLFKKLSTSPAWQNSDPPGYVKMSQLWLDSKQKSIPILKLACMYEGFHGQDGNYTLLTFNRGLKQSPVVANYRYYADFYGSFDATFDTVDERGYLVVTVRELYPE